MRFRFLVSVIIPLAFCLILISNLSATDNQLTENKPTTTIDTPTGGTGEVFVTVVITPTKDNTLYEPEPKSNEQSNGAGEHLFVGKTGGNAGNTLRRGVLAFDLSGKIPLSATIVSASITLEATLVAPTGNDEQTTFHRLTSDWGEGTSDAGDPGGAGTDPTTNDATWAHSFYSATMWTTPGGDFIATPSVTTTVGSTGSYTWNSTPALVADIQGWLDQPATNYGWIIRGNEIDSTTAKRFATKEHANTAFHPVLTIEYVPHQNFLPLILNN